MSDSTSPQALPRNPARPDLVVSAEEIGSGDPGVWRPMSYAEWEAGERAKTFLVAWTNQMMHEQRLRTMGAKAIFGLIGLQVIGVFAIVIAQGQGTISLDVGLLKILMPSLLAEVFGLGFVVTKYLFSEGLRHGLDSLVRGADNAD